MIHALNYMLFFLASLTGAPQDCTSDDVVEVCATVTASSDAPAPPPPPEESDSRRVRHLPIAISNGF